MDKMRFLIGGVDLRRKKGMNKIRRIHKNFDNLYGNYKTLPETDEAYVALESFIENNGLLGDAGSNPHRSQLYKLISNFGAENEMQGFVYGFKYAFSLFLETIEDYQC